MKDKLIKIIKRRKWTILLQVVLLLINVYLLTYPAKIVGNIIDLLYDIEKNNGQILLNTYYLIGFCLLLLIMLQKSLLLDIPQILYFYLFLLLNMNLHFVRSNVISLYPF